MLRVRERRNCYWKGMCREVRGLLWCFPSPSIEGGGVDPLCCLPWNFLPVYKCALDSQDKDACGKENPRSRKGMGTDSVLQSRACSMSIRGFRESERPFEGTGASGRGAMGQPR